MIRQEAQNTQNNQDSNALQVCMACIMVCVANIIERLTNFTTISMAITGRSFMDSATLTFDLLKVCGSWHGKKELAMRNIFILWLYGRALLRAHFFVCDR